MRSEWTGPYAASGAADTIPGALNCVAIAHSYKARSRLTFVVIDQNGAAKFIPSYAEIGIHGSKGRIKWVVHSK